MKEIWEKTYYDEVNELPGRLIGFCPEERVETELYVLEQRAHGEKEYYAV